MRSLACCYSDMYIMYCLIKSNINSNNLSSGLSSYAVYYEMHYDMVPIPGIVFAGFHLILQIKSKELK